MYIWRNRGSLFCTVKNELPELSFMFALNGAIKYIVYCEFMSYWVHYKTMVFIFAEGTGVLLTYCGHLYPFILISFCFPYFCFSFLNFFSFFHSSYPFLHLISFFSMHKMQILSLYPLFHSNIYTSILKESSSRTQIWVN